MARRKTHEEFLAEVKALVGDEYTVCGEYKTSKSKIEFYHRNCGVTYSVKPNHFLSGVRCPTCAGNKKKTTEEFKKEVFELSDGEYEVVSNYTSAHVKVKIKHNKCGNMYSVTPAVFTSGRRCAYCYGNKKKTSEEFKKEVYSIVNEEYEVIGEYENTVTKLEMKHHQCGRNYFVRPNDFLRGRRCPRCEESKGERKIGDWLEAHGIQFTPQVPIKYSPNKSPLFLDFLANGVAIEYDGEYHFKSFAHSGGNTELQLQQRRDRAKDKYCLDNRIPLIRISYWEFDLIDAILTKKLLPLVKDRRA